MTAAFGAVAPIGSQSAAGPAAAEFRSLDALDAQLVPDGPVAVATSAQAARDLAADQVADAAYAAGQAADPSALGRNLIDGIGAASESYRKALALALDPSVDAGLRASVSPTALNRAGAGPGGVDAAFAPTGDSFAAAPAPLSASDGSGSGGANGGPAPLLSQTDQASEASLNLLLDSHAQIMRRQIGVMSATTTMDAASSGARRSSQNLDTLLRGQ